MTEKDPSLEDTQPIKSRKPFWLGWTGQEYEDWLIAEAEKRGLHGRIRRMKDRPPEDTMTLHVTFRPNPQPPKPPKEDEPKE